MKKKHIVESEMVDKKGRWKPKADLLAKDADKVIMKLIERHKGQLSLCSIQSIIECSVNHHVMKERMLATIA